MSAMLKATNTVGTCPARSASARAMVRPAAVLPRAAARSQRVAFAAPKARAVAARATRSFTQHMPIGGNISQAIEVFPDEAGVGAALCATVEAAAKAAIAEKGYFTLAVPGGSVLKALAGLTGAKLDWSKIHMFYVNHKVGPLDSKDSTHHKAKGLFVDAVKAPNVYAPPGSSGPNAANAKAEASGYAESLSKAAAKLNMARNSAGVPRFDLMLLGAGADGHVGSLYPGRPEPLSTQGYVLSVVRGEGKASITMSLPLMNAAKKVVVCMTGDKKAGCAKTALESPVPVGDLPVQLVKPDAIHWLLDAGAASELAMAKAASTLSACDMQTVRSYLDKSSGAATQSDDPLEAFCLSNPDADECRVYED